MKPVVHNKTGNIYYVVDHVINATNANEGQQMVLYTRDGDMYVRESTEFDEKFTLLQLKVGDLVAMRDGIFPVSEINKDEVILDTPTGPVRLSLYFLIDPWRVIQPGATVLIRGGITATILEPQDLRNTTAIAVRTPTGMAKIALNEIHSVLAYNPDSLFSNID